MNMSKIQSATRGELSVKIDADLVAEKAEDKFHTDNLKRSKLSTRIAHYMPNASLIVTIAAIIVSSPFTIGFFSLMFLPILIGDINLKYAIVIITPIVIEGVIILLAASREYGNGDWVQTLLLGLLLTFSTLVNVLGAISALQVRGFENWLDYAYMGTAVLAGVLVSSVGYIVGGMVIKMATGKIKMEIDSSELWTGAIRDEALRRAFENAASKITTIARAKWYADNMVERYSDIPKIVTASIEAIGGQSGLVQQVQAVSSEMGFLPMAQVGGDNVLSNTANTVQTKVTTQTYPFRKLDLPKAIKWFEANPDGWQAWAVHTGKLKNCQAISFQLTGNIKGAKTVDRAMKHLNIVGVRQ